jgi:hypothetical protein
MSIFINDGIPQEGFPPIVAAQLELARARIATAQALDSVGGALAVGCHSAEQDEAVWRTVGPLEQLAELLRVAVETN